MSVLSTIIAERKSNLEHAERVALETEYHDLLCLESSVETLPRFCFRLSGHNSDHRFQRPEELGQNELFRARVKSLRQKAGI